MKQKIVIKAHMTCDNCRRKALTIAAETEGVNSMAIEGTDKDQVVVVGDGIDSARLTLKLKKKLGSASILKVEEVKDKTEDKEKKLGTQPIPCQYSQYYRPQVIYYHDPCPTNSCSIL